MSPKEQGIGIEQAAHHEAAHAVVAAAYGGRVIRVSASKGVTDWNPKEMSVRARVRVALAGPVMGGIRNESVGAGRDGAEAMADIMVAGNGIVDAPGLLIEEAFNVRRLLGRPELKAAVEHLAAALVKHGELHEEDLVPFLGPLQGYLPQPNDRASFHRNP